MIPHSRPWITETDRRAVEAALGEGMIAEGQRVARFEREIAGRCGAAGGVAAASGTAALGLALRGLGLERGEEVVLPSYVCHAVRDAVVREGGVPASESASGHCRVSGSRSARPEGNPGGLRR